MSEIVELLGQKGLVGVVGLIIFLFCYKYSQGIFDWIEAQTFGTRNYIMEKLGLLFIEVKEEYITYLLLFLSVGMGMITLIVVGVIGSWTVGAILGGLVGFFGFKIPKPIINWMIQRRIRAYTDQLIDALTLLSNGIRAGLSVPQAIGMVTDEMPAPVSQEFNMMLQQNKIGVPLEECFENLAKRVPTEDNDMFVSAVNILRETGGNLAETFDTIVGVIRERIRLAQKIEQLTASGKFQGYVIASMPFGIGLIYYFTDPESMGRMFTHPLGIVLMIVALMFDIAGLYVIMKIVEIKN